MAIALAACCATSVLAGDRDFDRFKFRAFVSMVSPSAGVVQVGETTEIGDPPQDACLLTDCFSLGHDAGTGFQANFEFRPIHLIGVELGGARTEVGGELQATVAIQNPDLLIDFSSPFDDEIRSDMLYAGVNFHVWKKGSMVDVYVGPFYAALSLDDGTITIPSRDINLGGDPAVIITTPEFIAAYTFDDENSWGINSGFDVNVGKHGIVSGSLRYVVSEPEMTIVETTTMSVEGPFKKGFDPLILSVGGGVRF